MSAAEQRKLHKVYEDLEAHRYKPALAELSRYLKKQPKSQLALCLKVVCLGSMDAPEEETLAAYEVAQRYKPFSEIAAYSLAFAFKNMKRPDLVLGMYQEMWDAQPKNLELGEQVFLAAVEMWDTKSMMQSSRRIASATQNPKAARWAAFCHFVQFQTLPSADNPFPKPAPPKSMLMANHFLSQSTGVDDRIPHPSVDIVWLNIQILLADDQPAKAWEYLKEHTKNGSLRRKWLRMQAAMEIGERAAALDGAWDGWREEWEWAKAIIMGTGSEPERNFAYYRHWTDCLAQILQAAGNPASHPALTETKQLLIDLETQHGSRERAPLLALLELHTRATQEMVGEPQEWFDLLERYWDAWGSKNVACDELDGVIPEDRFTEVVEMLKLTIKSDHGDLVAFKRILTLETLLVARRPVGEIDLALAQRHWALYQSGLKYGENLGKDDVQHADPAAYMTVHALLAYSDPSVDKETRLLQVAACLEMVAATAPASAYARFLLIRVYRYLGAMSLAIPHLDAMKITEIQLDTLLHVFVERGAAESLIAGVSDYWSARVATSKASATRADNELRNAARVAIECESYSKIGGIRELRATLRNSLPSHHMQVENVILHAISNPRELVASIKSSPLLPEFESLTEDSLKDTRDWDLIPNLGPDTVRLKQMTECGDAISVRSALATAASLRDLAAFVTGKSAVPEASLNGAEDQAALGAVHKLLEYARQRVSEATEGDLPGLSLDPYGSELVQALDRAAPLDRLRVGARILEFRSDLAMLIIGTEASTTKGKPKPVQTATAALHAELRETKKAFDAQVLEVMKNIDERKGDGPAKALLPEAPIDDVRRKVLAARQTGWTNFRKIMKKQ